MRNIMVFKMAVVAFLSAVILVMTFIPNLGFINLFVFVSLTIVPIPVILGGQLLGYKSGLWLGLIFGLASWWASFRNPGPIDVLFQNPLLAVFPRVIFGLSTGFLHKKEIRVKGKDIKIPFLVFIFSVFHTLLVVSLLFLVGLDTLQSLYNTSNNNVFHFIGLLLASNGLMEAVLATVVVTAMYYPVKTVMNRYYEAEI